MRAEPGGPRAENALRSQGGDTHTRGWRGGTSGPTLQSEGPPSHAKGPPPQSKGPPHPLPGAMKGAQGSAIPLRTSRKKHPFGGFLGCGGCFLLYFFTRFFFVVVVIFAVAPAALLPRPCTAPPLRGGSAICGPHCAALRSHNAGPRSCPA